MYPLFCTKCTHVLFCFIKVSVHPLFKTKWVQRGYTLYKKVSIVNNKVGTRTLCKKKTWVHFVQKKWVQSVPTFLCNVYPRFILVTKCTHFLRNVYPLFKDTKCTHFFFKWTHFVLYKMLYSPKIFIKILLGSNREFCDTLRYLTITCQQDRKVSGQE